MLRRTDGRPLSQASAECLSVVWAMDQANRRLLQSAASASAALSAFEAKSSGPLGAIRALGSMLATQVRPVRPVRSVRPVRLAPAAPLCPRCPAACACCLPPAAVGLPLSADCRWTVSGLPSGWPPRRRSGGYLGRWRTDSEGSGAAACSGPGGGAGRPVRCFSLPGRRPSAATVSRREAGGAAGFGRGGQGGQGGRCGRRSGQDDE